MTTETRDTLRDYPWLRWRTRALHLRGLALLRRPLILYLVALPNLVSVLYFGLIASPIYVSRADLRVINPASNSSSLTSVLSGGSGDGSSEGAYILKSYAQSWDAFRTIDRQLDLGAHYSRGDFASGFGGLATLFARNDIALWHYYRDRIEIEVDVKSGIASVDVEGYSPEFARLFAATLLRDAVDHLDRMNRREQKDTIAAALARREALQRAVDQDNAVLARYRGRVGSYDPKSQYESDLSLLNTLQTKAGEYRAQYAAVRAATPNNPEAKNLTHAIAAIEAKVAATGHEIATLEQASAGYDALVARRNNDVSTLQQAGLAALDAQQHAVQDRYYLSVISEPSTSDTPELPLRLYWIAGTALVTLLLWGLLR